MRAASKFSRRQAAALQVVVRDYSPLGLRCEVVQALCFGCDEEGALGEDRLAEHAAGADREGFEDGAGGGIDQVGAGGITCRAKVGASGEHARAVERGGAHHRAGQAGLPGVAAGCRVDLADRSAEAGTADGGGIAGYVKGAAGPFQTALARQESSEWAGAPITSVHSGVLPSGLAASA